MRSDSSNVKTLCIETARPSESNPAPTLALVAGTVTVTIYPAPSQSSSFFMASATLPPSTSIFSVTAAISADVAASTR